MVNAIRNLNLDVYLIIRRILAVAIDSVILAIIMSWVISSFGSMHVTGGTIPTNYTSTYSVDWYWYPVLFFAYFFMQEASFSCTIGNLVAQTLVARRNSIPALAQPTPSRRWARLASAACLLFLLASATVGFIE